MPEKLLTHENSSQFSIMHIVAVPVIIFLYFLQWKTHVFYGDDLSVYNQYIGLETFSEKMNMPVAAQKFRPIHGIGIQLLIDSFGKNSNGYYWFNVLVQSINTLIFAHLLNLYLKSPFLSLLFGLLLGLSRFAFFNIAQLTSGGALEGLALTFFLCCLYFIVKIFKSGNEKTQSSANYLYAILFANLSIYTHERYIVLFPFLLLVLIVDATLKKVKQRQKTLVTGLILGSILLNVFVKKYVFGMPFFVGTGGTNVEFSFSSAFSFLKEAVLSIFLINTGPEYLIGIGFPSLGGFYRKLIIVILVCVFSILVASLVKGFRNSSLKMKGISPGIIDFLLLTTLFFLCLAPAVVTIRVEQRWLQASYSIFVLVIIMSLTAFKFSSIILRNASFALLALGFLIADHQYLSKGANNSYMMSSENTVAVFKKAIDNGTIRSSAKNLYILEKRRDENAENAAKWSLGNGNFFEFYTGKSKTLIFIDSVYERVHSTADTSFFHFNPQTDQILYTTNQVNDVTDNFLRDSLRNFDGQLAKTGLSPDKSRNDSVNVIVSQDNFSNFTVEGFYEKENGTRWTNGKASIGFIGNYGIKDSVYIKLETYLPPKCKKILPRVSLIAVDNKTYQATLLKKKGDNFLYGLYVENPADISRILILSDTINAHPDVRKLSFPFVSLELKQSTTIPHKN